MLRLDKVKAERSQLEEFKQEFVRLENMIERLQNDFTEGEGFDDEFEGEDDSEVDDVKSLADGNDEK